ncbi:hypothetical protein [Parendozoicomonas sp. Alg238-R29]|uniref:hypothetical protein n=1 Tax=Parendozoicomonas sp. Alg238-R29 TaxID=2993446 RepID=UPI00248EBE41|nr:hypothetical protein [Parendozoicomonas sp. Alg238-R29]
MRTLILCLLLVSWNISFAASQGSLGTTSSASFSIRLVIPSKLEVQAPPDTLSNTPEPFCITGRGVDYYSTSVLPLRGSERPSPHTVTFSGYTSVPNKNSVTYLTSSDCSEQTVAITPNSQPSKQPATILIAPE